MKTNEKYVILPDVACDLDDDIRKEYGVEDYVKGHLVLPSGEDVHSELNWNLFTSAEFYEDLKKRPSAYATAPGNIDEYIEKFEGYVKEGYAVISVSISSALSGSYNFSVKAMEDVVARYPDAKIHCVDSLRFGPGLGLLVINAAILKRDGKSYEEVVDYLENQKNTFHQTGWLDDLSFVAKKGRLNHAAAFFGTLVGIKPLGEFDHNGLTTVIGKAKGEKSAYKALLGYMEAEIVNPEEQIILIAETNRRKQAEAYKSMIEEKFHPKEIIIQTVHATNGVNVGPGLMAAYYIGKPISEGLTEERALMEKLLSGK